MFRHSAGAGSGTPARLAHMPAAMRRLAIFLLLMCGAVSSQGLRAAVAPPSAEAHPAVPGSADAGWWDGFGGTNALENRVESLTVLGNSLIAGGWFAEAGTQIAPSVARWSGGTWSAMGVGLNSAVYALQPFEGRLIAGGDFTTSGFTSVSRIASWNGTQWTPLGSGMNQSVFALTVHGGALVAGGSFTTAGGVPAERVAWWDGLAWNTFGSGGMNMPVYALAVHDGCLIAGGAFTEAGAVSCSYIAKLCDGVHWEPLGEGMNGAVMVLGEYGGDLIAGGSFTTAGGEVVNHIARWDGTAWHPLGINLAIGTNGTVSALGVFDDHLIVGGGFTRAGSEAASNVARWDGGDWRTLGSGTDGAVTDFAVVADSLFVGGGFMSAGGKESPHIAKWIGSVTAVALSSFTAERSGRAVEVRWQVAEERGHAGFHVFRGEAGGERSKLTGSLLSGLRDYRFVDREAPATEVLYWLQEVSRSGGVSWIGPVAAPAAGAAAAPAFAVTGVGPVPSRGLTTFSYALPEAGPASVTVHDAQGRLVRALSEGPESAGSHEAVWDGLDAAGAPAASGVYFIRVVWNGQTRAARAVLAR